MKTLEQQVAVLEERCELLDQRQMELLGDMRKLVTHLNGRSLPLKVAVGAREPMTAVEGDW